MNLDNTPKGFAYICFEDEEGVKKCLADKENEGTVSQFNQNDTKVGPDMNVTQLYFRNVPLGMTEDKVKPIFEPFGDIKQFTLMKGEKGQYGYVWYEDKTGQDKQHGVLAVSKAVETLSEKDMGEGVKLVVTKYMSKE